MCLWKDVPRFQKKKKKRKGKGKHENLSLSLKRTYERTVGCNYLVLKYYNEIKKEL